MCTVEKIDVKAVHIANYSCSTLINKVVSLVCNKIALLRLSLLSLCRQSKQLIRCWLFFPQPQSYT